LLAVAGRAWHSTGAMAFASPEAIVVEAAASESETASDPDSVVIFPEAVECTPNGESCALSGCCSEAGMTCYKKDETWSSCNETCNPHYKWVEDENGWAKTNKKVWDCEEIKPPCSLLGEDCSLSKCCANPHMKCYTKHEGFNMCNLTCDPNNKWTNESWVKTSEVVWGCEDITVARPANTTHAAGANVSTASASSHNASTASASSHNASTVSKNSSNASTASRNSSNASTSSATSSNASTASGNSSKASTASASSHNASTASASSHNASTASNNIFVHSSGASVASASSSPTEASHNSQRSGTARKFLCFALSVGFANTIAPFVL